jgi:alpha-L-rhamnosidase
MAVTEDRLRVDSLRTHAADDVLAGDAGPVRLTWTLRGTRSGATQAAYEIEVGADPELRTTMAVSGEVAGDAQVAVVAPGGRLASREVRYYRVRVRSSDGWSPWSDVQRHEAGLLEPSDWVGEAITLPDDPGAVRTSPVPILRREFEIDGPVRQARLYVTALGLYQVTLNGRRVGDDLLGPGWTPYGKRLIADAYDVTDLLVSGMNVLGAAVGDGWYRGRIGWAPTTSRARYGTRVALLAQLEIAGEDGTVTIATDQDWRASTGEILGADLYDGSHIDLRERHEGWDRPGFDASGWGPVEVVPFDRSVIEPRIAPPVRAIATLPCHRAPLSGGGWLLDSGQNVSGWVRMRVRGAAGSVVTVRHAEVLERDGSLHTRSLRSALATDTYVLADDAEVDLEPVFTFHGFRFAEVRGDVEIVDAAVVAISSVGEPRGRFTCSEPLLERLHENVLWSLRDNFVSVPTDCPQRDERLGWTGDAQAFASTATVLVDSRAFWMSWLRDLALEQDPVLGVATVVPDVVLDGEPRYGRAGWADAAAIVPWAVYEAYGDVEVLRRQFPSMRAHVDSLEVRLAPDGLLPDSMQFGDWLDPDAPPERPWLAKADSRFIANAFLVHSARLTADAARVLDDPAAADHYERLGSSVATRTWATWADHAMTTQTGCAVGLELGVAPAEERDRVGEALAELVRRADGAVATGFLGTPLVLPALAATDHYDEAFLMLLRQTSPSWLYQVVAGGTTVWERWDAIRPDGSIHDGRMTPFNDSPTETDEGVMLSFNHYAYGAVVDWVYRHVAGIAPAVPGYRSIRFAPHPAVGLARAAAEVDTPYGRAAIAWMLGPDSLRIDIDVPPGATGTLDLRLGPGARVTVDGRAFDDGLLGSGHHEVLATDPLIARPNRNLGSVATLAPRR